MRLRGRAKLLLRYCIPVVACEEQEQRFHPKSGERIPGLPVFTRAEVANHTDKDRGIWVTYKEGVYDVTNFVEKHPGGDKILLGAGKAVDPFWRLYAQHLNLPYISHLMEEMRIGNLDPNELLHHPSQNLQDSNDDLYRIDASIERHPGLVFVTERPANAEVPASLLCDSFLTPSQLFFIRNHFPVPDPLAKGADQVSVFSQSPDELEHNKIILTVNDLTNVFQQHDVIATIQCTGNRRNQFNESNSSTSSSCSSFSIKGLPWSVGAISTAKWSGPKLCDVIKHAFPEGVPSEMKHVCFTGRDSDGNGQHYGVSIHIDQAMDPRSDVIIATRMNDEPLPLDHGAPIRVIVPGSAGCRSVKWLKEIFLSKTESNAFWQKQDYKSFSPSQGWEGIDFDSAPSVMATPVQSAICHITRIDSKSLLLKGYSFSGGGNAIIRVDVSADGGKSWTNAELQGEEHDDEKNFNVQNIPFRRTYSWTLWTALVEIPTPSPHEGFAELVVKAVDESYNSQPENSASIRNVRGILNNSWHKMKFKL